MAATAFLQAKVGLEAHCHAFAQAELLKVEPKKLYQLADFDALQEAHQSQVPPHTGALQNCTYQPGISLIYRVQSG